jgi:hypothetical protein
MNLCVLFAPNIISADDDSKDSCRESGEGDASRLDSLLTPDVGNLQFCYKKKTNSMV